MTNTRKFLFFIIFPASAFIALALLCAGGIWWFTHRQPDVEAHNHLVLTYAIDYSSAPSANPAKTASETPDILRRRINPENRLPIVVRPTPAGDAVTVLIALGDDTATDAYERSTAARDALAAATLPPSAIEAALRLEGDARDKTLKELAGGNSERMTLLNQAQDAFDKSQAAEAKLKEYKEYKDLSKVPTEVWSQTNAAAKEYDAALRALLATNIDLDWLDRKLDESDGGRNKTAAAEIDACIADHPGQAALLVRYRNEFSDLLRRRGPAAADPAAIRRLLAGRGVLEFRIAVTPANAPAPNTIAQAQDFLHKGRSAGGTMPPNTDWFEIDPFKGTEMLGQDYRLSGSSGLVIETFKNQSYVLLYTDPLHAMTDPTGNHWQLTHASRAYDPATDQIIVNFAFDPVGGRKLATLTADNVRQPMAILLDDKALTAPNIRTAITQGAGIITFNTSRTRTPEMVTREADALAQTLQAGSLPFPIRLASTRIVRPVRK